MWHLSSASFRSSVSRDRLQVFLHFIVGPATTERCVHFTKHYRWSKNLTPMTSSLSLFLLKWVLQWNRDRLFRRSSAFRWSEFPFLFVRSLLLTARHCIGEWDARRGSESRLGILDAFSTVSAFGTSWVGFSSSSGGVHDRLKRYTCVLIYSLARWCMSGACRDWYVLNTWCKRASSVHPDPHPVNFRLVSRIVMQNLRR